MCPAHVAGSRLLYKNLPGNLALAEVVAVAPSFV